MRVEEPSGSPGRWRALKRRGQILSVQHNLRAALDVLSRVLIAHEQRAYHMEDTPLSCAQRLNKVFFLQPPKR